MKQYTILLITLLLMAFEPKADSSHNVIKPLSKKKNIVEYSLNSLNLFDGQGYTLTEPRFNFAYTRLFHKDLFAKIEYFEYSRSNSINEGKSIYDYKRGDVVYTSFNFVRLNVGKQFVFKKINFKPSIGLNYRWGFGEKYRWDNGAPVWESHFNKNKMNSLGVGVGTGVYYPIYKAFQLGVEYNFQYNFEKYKYSENDIPKEESDAFNFQPNRKYSTLQLKLGYLF